MHTVHLTQRTHVIHDPESTAMCGDHEIIAVHVDVAHGGDGQALLQRLPMRAIVEGDVDAELRAGIEESRPYRILTHDVDEAAARNA